MATKRVQFNNIVQNQLPQYVRTDYPLVSDFLKTYYQGQEYQGGPIDLIQNIDEYVKVDKTTDLTLHVGLGASVGITSETIEVDMKKYPTGTLGFPDSYGLLKINDEIITYTGITTFAFTGCVRGFSGITSYTSPTNPEELVFESTDAEEHNKGDIVQNLSSLFLKEFLVKTKHQLTPGFEGRTLTANLNQNVFIKQAKDFYLSKGTDRGFEILFKALYNENVKIVRPSEFLFTPSNANYKITNDFVVEPIYGNPEDLEFSTLYQDGYDEIFNKAYAPITDIEKIQVSAGTTFYKFSIDAGYNRDSGVQGVTYGTFHVHPRTKLIGEVGAGITVIDVDSTVGFGTTGELYFNYVDNTVGVSSYTSKNLTQFFGLTGIGKTISDQSTIGINTFAYGKSSVNPDETIEVRITSVLNSLEFSGNNCLYGSGDTAHIKTLGVGNTGFKASDWFYNIAPVYKVKNIVLKDSSDWTYEVNLNVNHDFKIGDKAVIIGNDSIALPISNITQITSDNSIILKGQGEIDVSKTFTIERQILKSNAINYPGAAVYATNVQNVYQKKGSPDLLVASSSIPTYGAQTLGLAGGEFIFGGTFSGDEFKVITNSTTTPTGVPVVDHGFYTGDAVYYTPQIVNNPFVDPTSGTSIDNFEVRSGLFDGDVDDEGLYFVQRVNETTLKFAKSRTNLANGIFVSVNSNTNTGIVTDNKIGPYDFNNKTLQSQKLLRQVTPPIDTGTVDETTPGTTGILVNGVEILNYKSYDQVHYGKLESIDVLAPGEDYDVINPPFLNISDSIGVGGTGYVAVSGSLQELRLLNPGFDYEAPPTIKITGGNGSDARASVNMQLVEHSVSFDAAINTKVGLGTTVGSSYSQSLPSTIGFGTYHKFRNAEEVVYVTGGQTVVGGLTTDAHYFVSQVGPSTVRLHTTEAGARAGINTVELTSFGIGKQYLKSINKKSIIGSINILSGGTGYQNKKRTATPAGINTALNQINIDNHDYESGEIVNYTCNGTFITGLTTSTDFYVTKIDNDNFKLSSVGVGTTAKDFYYNTQQYRNLETVGVGTHIFNYQDINVTLVGKVGIDSIGVHTFEAEIQPIFRGEITSIHLEDKGVGYGSSEVVNFVKEPQVTLSSGVNGQVSVTVSQGKIIAAYVDNGGTEYNSPPDIVVDGDGSGAVLTPVMKTVGIGTTTQYVIDEVKVIEQGAGYSASGTTVDVVSAGSGVNLRSNIQKWNVNLFEKYYQTEQIVDDDGFIKKGLNSNYDLQYAHLYAPRKLRESVYAVNQEGDSLYGQPDLRKVNGIESPSENHSPIIGWAYDGNPIYGPYGYIKQSGGTVGQMKSGYVQEAAIKENRPSLSVFPAGFFIEDFTYKQVNDETILDENNGRFCITPEYPSGTYAYFATISDGGAEQGGKFNTFKLPVFPYLIGHNYQSTPLEFNFNSRSNQDQYELEKSDWCRITTPYNLVEGDLNYPYMPIPNQLSQTVDIKGVETGSVESIGIVTGGINYKVHDQLVFDNTDTDGSLVDAKVQRLLGKHVSSVSAATSTLSSVEIYPSEQKGRYQIISDEPHNWINQDVITITGLSTTSSKIEGSYVAGISSNRLSLTGVGTTSVAIGTDGATGIVTHFDVEGDLVDTKIRENDILGIGTEQVKVLNVEPLLSRIRVLRAVNGVTGVSHTVTTELLEDPRKITVNAGFNSTYDYRINKQYYFNPVDSVGVSTLSGVGIGSTIVFTNPGVGITELFIQSKAIYLPKHQLKTGDKLTYSPNNGSGITIWESGKAGAASGITTLVDGQSVFAAVISADLVGISTCKVGMGTTGTFVGIASTQRDSTTVFFSGIGTGVYHSFKTNFSPITAEANRIKVTVATAQTHGLLNNDDVHMDVSPGLSTTFVVQYNDYNRRIVIDPKSFTAAGVNTTTNAFTITDHGFKTGEKIIHTSSSPCEGLTDNAIYYIIKVDDDTFKLANTYHEATELKPNVVGVADTSTGTINPINPSVKGYKNQDVIFDLSHSSLGYSHQSTDYPAFRLNLYTDENFTKVWDTSKRDSTFNVVRSGKPGVSTDAKVTVSVTENIPEILFYKFDPVYESTLPTVKAQIDVDPDIVAGNELQVVESNYNGKQKITVAATNQFTYTLNVIPERVSYGSTSNLSYTTDSINAYGAISKLVIDNQGANYRNLPGITTITTAVGSGAVLEAQSTSIGKIKKVKINDIGYNFPSDTTIKPSVALPQIVKIEALTSVESVGVSSFGRGYVSAPELVVLDGKTNKVISDIDLRYTLGNPEVEILKNTYGITNTPPKIIPDRNSNGVGISTVGFNTVSKDVTVTLSVGFSTADSFPFGVGDNVFVEGIGVGIGTTARGYNSEDYGYKLFTLTAVDQNYGGIGTVTYNLSDYFTSEMAPELTPGQFDSINSAGRIVPEKYFPLFDVRLKPNDFVDGETVVGSISSTTGTVENWYPNTGILRVSSNDDFVINDVIEGLSSKTQGVASSIKSFDSYLITDASSRVESGWETDSGFFNKSLQRIQDSDYYQNLSYSIRSRVDMDTWNDPVSTLNHTLGFKKFSDYQLEALPDNKQSLVVGLSTELTDVSVVNDLYSIGDTNCVYDFDLVKENALTIGSNTLSNEITFSNRILQDYSESVGNRVVSINDFSGTFNHLPRSTRFSVVDTFTLSDRRALKYITYVRDKRFTAQRQLMIVDILHDGSLSYINQYGRVETVYDQGSFDFSIAGSEGQLVFYPERYAVNDYWIANLSYNLDDNLLTAGSTVIGPSLIDNESVTLSGIGTTTVVGIASTYRSAKVMVAINPDQEYNEYEYTQLNIVHNGDEVEVMEWGRMITTPDSWATSGMGTFRGYIDGSNLKIDFIPNSDVGIGTTGVINTTVVAMGDSTSTGIGTVDLNHAKLQCNTTGIAAAGSPGINTVAQFSSDYECAYCFIQVTDATNQAYQFSEFVVVTDFESGETTETFDTEWANVYSGNAGLGTLGSKCDSSGTVSILFTPNASINTQVNVYMNALKIADDSKSVVDLGNGYIQSGFGEYSGTESDIKRAFPLEHRDDPIFEKEFDGSDSAIISAANNTVILPNHFFVTGEKITYNHAGTGKTMAVGIATTNGFVGVGTTNKLPGDLWVVKIDDDTIKLAETAEKALKTVPEVVDITSVGIGTSHRFNTINQNARVMVAIDNLIQSPIVSTSVTTHLIDSVLTTDDTINFAGITSFYGSDLVQIGSEIMRLDAIGIGTSANQIRVKRPWAGTALAGYGTGTLVTKVDGNYNIVDNTINFVEAPYGLLPISSSTNAPDDRDWVGIATGSSFQGRMFMRSGVPDTANESYYRNYIFDSLSSQFTGQKDAFTLQSEQSNVSGLTTDNAIILINDIFQTPGSTNEYTLEEGTAGVTTITFTGTGSSVPGAANVGTLPMGGIIVSVGSTEGFGYQPLVAAGGTVTVSAGGTIKSVSIGNTGSGYRAGIQTVNVGIKTLSRTGTNVIGIGTAQITTGHITGIAVTNMDHLFYSPRKVANVGYSSVTGISTITTQTNHGLSSGDEVTVSGIAFTCDYAGRVGIYTAVYDNSSGIMTVTTAVGHGLSTTGQKSVVIFTGLGFTCSLDAGANIHYYPRGEDRAYNTAVNIVGTSNTTITVDVGYGAPGDQFVHQFVSASSNAVITGGDYSHRFVSITNGAITEVSSGLGYTPTNATYDGPSGIVTFTLANHGLTTSNYVSVAQSSLVFRCSMDDYSTLHSYPRADDPIVGYGSTSITSASTNAFSINVGVSTIVNYNISTAVYSAAAGILTMTLGSDGSLHGLTTGTSIKIDTEALSFRCSRDNYASVHKYPRKPDPYYSGTEVTAVGVGTTTFECNIGVSTVPTYYVGYGSCQAAIVAPRASGRGLVEADPARTSSEVLRIVDSKSFEINSGVSSRNHAYARGGVVNGYSEVVFDDPLSYSGIGLSYSSSSVSGVGTGAEIDIVVGQGSSVISFTVSNTGSGYGNGEILTVPIGGNAGIPTDPSKTFVEFQINIEKVFRDEFTGWSVGQLQTLDNMERYIDGSRVDFPMTVNGDTLSIVAKKGSKIDVQECLLVFVNNIPQVPGKGYKFSGGSVITFTEAPKIDDTIDVMFYKGTGSEDVVERLVLETVKPGDNLTIGRLNSQPTWLQETARVPLSVDSTDLVKTPSYYGPGNTGDSDLERPVKWCRQTEDKIINEKGVGKDREIYEPVINPRSCIIKSVGIGSTIVYVESLRPFFDGQNEVLGSASADFTFQNKVKFISQENKTGAAGTALVSIAGTISSVIISNGGVGYSTATVSFGTTSIDGTEVGVGTTSTNAYGTPIIGSAGTITGIAITSVGAGYTSSNPPMVLISPPTWSEEENKISSYTGDEGIIVGFGTTTVGVATGYQLVFDLHIPLASDLRNSTIAGTAVTISGISTGDYFVVNDSIVGIATTTISSLAADGATIGIGTAFVDNVYETSTFEIVQAPTGVHTNGVGIGTTHLKRVFVKIGEHLDWSGQWPSFSGVGIQTGNYFGSYSWGKIVLPSRSESNSYNAYTDGGVGGITTSMVVRRSASLKYKNYKVT